jgi:hypothetical protein
VDDKTLRRRLIRLAYERPDLRDHVLPLVAPRTKRAMDPSEALGDAQSDFYAAKEKLIKAYRDTMQSKEVGGYRPWVMKFQAVLKVLDKCGKEIDRVLDDIVPVLDNMWD